MCSGELYFYQGIVTACGSHDRVFHMKNVSIISFELLVNYFLVIPLPI